jgi:hypothetical protein
MTDDTLPSPELKHYKTALKVARQRFKEATDRLENIHAESQVLDDEISKLRRTITALSALCSESPGFDDLGITDSVDQLMSNADSVMTTADVVRALESEGFDFSAHKNAAHPSTLFSVAWPPPTKSRRLTSCERT